MQFIINLQMIFFLTNSNIVTLMNDLRNIDSELATIRNDKTDKINLMKDTLIKIYKDLMRVFNLL